TSPVSRRRSTNLPQDSTNGSSASWLSSVLSRQPVKTAPMIRASGHSG
ncbi:hypothetical protein D020_2296B, partial [Vibrio parahaemolyticus SBR10290]